jgi:hypothetical protein
MLQTPIVLSRRDLYTRVWAKPMREVAQELGISDVGLDKVCDRLGVPTTYRGYWAKKAAGEPVEQPPPPSYQYDSGVPNGAEPQNVERR